MGIVISFLAGTLFATGLALSGMTQPSKVIGFLDVLGSWDPSLLFVLGGATSTMMLMYRWARDLDRPIMADQFYRPGNLRVDSKLLVGSAIFGIGWGLAGLCPGPALASLPSFNPKILLFITTMALGMFVHFVVMHRPKLSS